MLISLEQVNDADKLNSDVIVVGSGAVGLMVAIALARRNKTVTLLEAGGIVMSADSQRFFESARPVSRQFSGLHSGRVRALGGTTNFWGGQLARLDPIVFDERPWMGSSVGWPISRADVDPFYAVTLQQLGMGARAPSDPEIIERLGMSELRIAPELGLFFTRWLPEPNFRSLFEREVRRRMNLRVIVNAPAVALVPSGSNEGHVRGVSTLDLTGRRVVLEAPDIVLANGTIEIARLLSLRFSNGQQTPWGSNVWLGRGFMEHLDLIAGDVRATNPGALHDVFDNAIIDGVKYQPKLKLSEAAQRAEGLGGVACHLIYRSSLSQDLAAAKTFIKGFLRGRLRGSLAALPGQLRSVLSVGTPMVVRYLRHRRIYSPTDRGIQIRLTCEQRPVADGGLKLAQERDSLGMPVVELDWRFDAAELETLARFGQLIKEFFEGNALGQVTLDPRLAARDPRILEDIIEADHHMGMARMGTSPATGVVDANLRLFGASNVFVAGAATFPSCGFSNPTFTAMALGIRLAEHLVSRSGC